MTQRFTGRSVDGVGAGIDDPSGRFRPSGQSYHPEHKKNSVLPALTRRPSCVEGVHLPPTPDAHIGPIPTSRRHHRPIAAVQRRADLRGAGAESYMYGDIQ